MNNPNYKIARKKMVNIFGITLLIFLHGYSQEILYNSQLEGKQVLIKVKLAKEEANMKNLIIFNFKSISNLKFIY